MTWRTLARLSVLSTAVLALLWNAAPAYAAGGGPPKIHQVSADPFTNVSSRHQTEIEAQTVAAGWLTKRPRSSSW